MRADNLLISALSAHRGRFLCHWIDWIDWIYAPRLTSGHGWTTVTWIAAGHGGAGVGRVSHWSCGGPAVVRCPAGLPGHGTRWRGAGRGRRGRGRGTGWTVSVTAPAPAVRGRMFSCPWSVRVSRDPRLHGRNGGRRRPGIPPRGVYVLVSGVLLGQEESGL